MVVLPKLGAVEATSGGWIMIRNDCLMIVILAGLQINGMGGLGEQANTRFGGGLVTKLRPTLCDPMHCSLPGSSVHGIFPGKNTGVGCHFLLQGNLPDPGIKPTSPASPALAGGFFIIESPGKPSCQHKV